MSINQSEIESTIDVVFDHKVSVEGETIFEERGISCYFQETIYSGSKISGECSMWETTARNVDYTVDLTVRDKVTWEVLDTATYEFILDAGEVPTDYI